MKNNRQKIILDIISNQDIETQHQLIEALEAAGVKSTQATISRDIKELRLFKELTSRGTYRYVAAVKENSDYSDRLRTIFKECAVSVALAQNIVVIKTLPGLANAASSALDNMNVEDVVGTIAGDDTSFVAMVDAEAAKRFCKEIRDLM